MEPQKLNNFTLRSWHNIDDDSLRRLFNNIEINIMKSLNSVNEKNEWLHRNLERVIDCLAPEKTICPRRPSAPWITSQIKNLQDRRDKLYRIFKRTGYAYKEDSLGNDLKRLGLVKQKNTQSVIKLDPNELNNFSILSSGDVNADIDVTDIIVDNINNANNNNNVHFHFSEVDDNIVKKCIMRITSNSVGPDNFSIKAYKCTLMYVLPVITDLFNKSITTGIFPVEWKFSHVIPIPKIKNAINCEDFRLLSLLNNLSKALERCVHDQIVKYINDNNFMDEYQIAFKIGLNTQTAVIKLCDDIRLAINESKVTIAIFFYLSKAFDSVNHKRLLHKLLPMNFSNNTINWIESYLTDRKQSVVVDGKTSYLREIVNDVPHCSVLGPLLFSIYVTDLTN